MLIDVVRHQLLFKNKVFVAGGYGDHYLDTIEILDWDESNHRSQWILRTRG